MPRQLVQVRIAESGVSKLEDLATHYGVTRSDVIRVCLQVAIPTKELHDLLKQYKAVL